MKLGFSEAMIPEGSMEAGKQAGLRLRPIQRIADLVAEIAGGTPRQRVRGQ